MPRATELTVAEREARDLFMENDREFAEHIATASEFMVVKFARETIEVKIEFAEQDGRRVLEKDRALCRRLQELQDRLMEEGR